jgi:hypothetical protein
MARYVKAFPNADPAWFYLHVGCQLSAYVIGVAGWGSGMKLGSESDGITFSNHRNVGIIVFCLATIQVIQSHFYFQQRFKLGPRRNFLNFEK